MQNPRDTTIISLREGGAKLSVIGGQFGISRVRARQIFQKAKLMEEYRNQGNLRGVLSARAVHTIIRVTENSAPTAIDLQKWLIRHPGDWERRLLAVPCSTCGTKTLGEIHDFVLREGLLSGTGG